ncbi:helix-turn-helix transcriptional regulator [Metasolibacillus sp.]|uniref:helix-turn-helix domain-containing protein n=1 Tax=Metasolibacillus sp. TaxID=2703680 RepID=UPI0025CD93B8|nr:helix-turn-helix transcriptional regulator [Metasolibacillus sp.]MCT6924097.1 helix-turn-helix transcriptional regulator [Metasolibacillus sp.]MCT6940204.1 helix-turn-helix transcriptional regulator [Metasolibacillus sp.]
MIKCNLAVLLAERNLKISEVAKRTGISRTTLTALSQNQSKGIQFDTFDNLCNYLKVKPNDLFIQEVFEYDFVVASFLQRTMDIKIELLVEIEYKSMRYKELIDCTVDIYKNDEDIESIAIATIYSDVIFEILRSIPITFKTSFEQEIIECIKSEIVIRFQLENEELDARLW